MTRVGMLWQFNKDEMFTVEKAVLRGLKNFKSEYGCNPNQIELNPIHFKEVFKGVKTLEGIPLVEGKQVFKNQAVYSFDDSLEEVINKRRIQRLGKEGWLAE